MSGLADAARVDHLDLEARNWLEDFLRDYPFTVILVAHDRYFLDVTSTRVTEVSSESRCFAFNGCVFICSPTVQC